MKKIKIAKQFQQKYKTQKCKQTYVNFKGRFYISTQIFFRNIKIITFDSSETDSDSLGSISENSSSSEEVTNFIACSRERRFDLVVIFFQLELSSLNFCVYHQNEPINCFIFIALYSRLLIANITLRK